MRYLKNMYFIKKTRNLQINMIFCIVLYIIVNKSTLLCVCVFYTSFSMIIKADLNIFSPMTAHLDSQQKFSLVNENFHSQTRPMCMYGKVYYGAPLKRTCPNLKFYWSYAIALPIISYTCKANDNKWSNEYNFLLCLHIYSHQGSW